MDALKATKGLVSLAAKRLDCDPGTVRNYVKRYVTVAAAIKEERETFVDIAEAKLMQAVQNGEAWAIAMVLKTLGRDRGYGDKMDIYLHALDQVKALAEARGVPVEDALTHFKQLVEARR